MTNASVLSEKKPPLTIQIWCNTATLWPQMHYRRFIRTLKILFTLWSLELFPNSKHVSITGGTITLYISYADCRKVTMYYLHPPFPDINDSCPSFVFLAVSVVLSAYRWASYTKMWSTWEWVSSFFENSIYGIIKVVFLAFLLWNI